MKKLFTALVLTLAATQASAVSTHEDFLRHQEDAWASPVRAMGLASVVCEDESVTDQYKVSYKAAVSVFPKNRFADTVDKFVEGYKRTAAKKSKSERKAACKKYTRMAEKLVKGVYRSEKIYKDVVEGGHTYSEALVRELYTDLDVVEQCQASGQINYKGVQKVKSWIYSDLKSEGATNAEYLGKAAIKERSVDMYRRSCSELIGSYL